MSHRKPKKLTFGRMHAFRMPRFPKPAGVFHEYDIDALRANGDIDESSFDHAVDSGRELVDVLECGAYACSTDLLSMPEPDSPFVIDGNYVTCLPCAIRNLTLIRDQLNRVIAELEDDELWDINKTEAQ